jgi:hypothetical protein
VQYAKFIDYLENLATATDSRALCESAAGILIENGTGPLGTLAEYMVNIGTCFREIAINMGDKITEYAINTTFKDNAGYVLDAYEHDVEPRTVAGKLYAETLTCPPKPTYVDQVYYDPKSCVHRGCPMLAEGVGDAARSIKEYVKSHAIPLAISAALGAGAATVAPKAVDDVRDAGHKATEMVQKSHDFVATAEQVQKWNRTGAIIGENMDGWKYVDRTQKPGVYGPHFRGVSMDELAAEDNRMDGGKLKLGWWVSPDGHKVFSTVTGKYFEPKKDFNDPSFTRADLGNPVGVGGHYVLPEDKCSEWDNEAYYGKGNI